MDRKKAFEVAMLGGALVMSLSGAANAATACSGGSPTTVTGTTTNFVKTTFSPKCSASTVVKYSDAGADFYVQGASVKGKTLYGAGTSGGTVTACTTATSSTGPSVGDPGTTAGGTGC